MIPEAAVEAAAKAIWARTRVDSMEDSSDYLHAECCRMDARSALKAAAPHMLAEAWDAGEEAGQDNAAAYQAGGAVASNPYS